MFDFRRMPPVQPKARKLKAQAITHLMNGAAFEFLSYTQSGHIRGRYKDYAGEWVTALWYDNGVMLSVNDKPPPDDLAFDWSTSR